MNTPIAVTGILWDNYGNNITADAMTPCVTRGRSVDYAG